MPLSLLLDLLVAILLVVTIGYALVLNRRLKGLKDHKAELDALAASFAMATGRAEESVGRLKSSVADLQSASERAQSLRDDLAFLVERGGTAADRLEDLVRAARDAGGESSRAPAAPKPAAKAAAKEAMAASKPGPFKEPTLSAKPMDEKKTVSDPAGDLLKALRSAR